MELTAEQKDIIATEIKRGQVMKIRAFAGAAKTTTLREYALQRPFSKFLYLAFNTENANSAQRSFPKNVKCQTVHSLAYGKTGFKYKHKLANLQAFTVKDHCGVGNYKVAKYLVEVINNFLCSSDAKIAEPHLIIVRSEGDPTDKEDELARKDSKTKQYLLEKANDIWKAMQDEKNLKVPMTHDGYLKLYQLMREQVTADFVMLDEAHDTNNVTLDIFLNQNAAKILVGDSHQAIYGFRRAFNAIDQTRATVEKYLSTSFRFGPAIAGIATMLLADFKAESRVVHGFQSRDIVGKINRNQPFTYIARTNGQIFDEAAKLSSQRGASYGFIGTRADKDFSPYDPYYFNRIEDIYRLATGQRENIKDASIKRFATFGELLSVANDKDCPDKELLARASVVRRYSHETPEVIRRIVAHAKDPLKADVNFVTAHRSKGLEYDQVVLADDFQQLLVTDENTGLVRPVQIDDIDPQEINLLYVAATRAKKTLELNPNLCGYQKFIESKK